jgi:hypothetical protein
MAHSPYIVQTLNRIETVQAMEVSPLYASTEPRNCIQIRELKANIFIKFVSFAKCCALLQQCKTFAIKKYIVKVKTFVIEWQHGINNYKYTKTK